MEGSMEADEVNFYKKSFINKQKNSIDALLKQKSQLKPSDPLLASAAKKSSDSLKVTHSLIKERLAKGLDDTIEKFEAKYPELKGEYFIAFIADENHRAEVVTKAQAINAVDDVSKSDAEVFFEKNKMANFNRSQFTLDTYDNPAYKELQKEVNNHMERNAGTLKYLRENRNQMITPENL
jgi:hypothetical protein